MSNRFRDAYDEGTLPAVPLDIAFVVAFTVTASAVLVVAPLDAPVVRYGLALPLFVFLPGYAIVAALFPESEGSTQRRERTTAVTSPVVNRTISPLERLVFSVGVSVAVVPLVGITLNVALSRLTTLSVVVSSTSITLVAAAIAGRRRLALSTERRFRVPYSRWIVSAVRPDSRAELAYNVVLFASIAVLAATFAYTTTASNGSHTEFGVLAEDESGDLTADRYPENITAQESMSLVLDVRNHEGTDVEYTVVAQLQDVDGVTPTRIQELRRFRVPVENGGTQRVSHSFTPSLTGENLRVVYLLYRGEPPEVPRGNNAYRRVHVWITVSE